MSIVKINAITVPPEAGDELGKRFAARAGSVDGQDGFEGFELFKPTDDRNVWLVVTRWRDEAAFQAWAASPAFSQGHQGSGASGHQGSGASGDHGGPVSSQSELWSYEVVLGSTPGE